MSVARHMNRTDRTDAYTISLKRVLDAKNTGYSLTRGYSIVIPI
jgi:hypothetical protein